MALQTLQANLATGETLYLVREDGSVLQVIPALAIPNNPAQLVPTWFVDAANTTGVQDGLSAATAFRTTEQLSNTLCPFMSPYTQILPAVTVNVAAGSYGALDLNIAASAGLTGLTFDVNCAFNAVTDTLTSVVNTVAGATQGRITLNSGAALTARQRIRSTSGANVGAITYGMGPLNAANDTFVKNWFVAPLTIVNIANGTTVALETLLATINRVRVTPIQANSAQLTVRINDAILPNGAYMPTTQGSSACLLRGCKITGGRVNANIRMENCQFALGAAPQLTGLNSVGQPVLAGCIVQGQLIIAFTSAVLNVGNCFDGGTVLVQQGQLVNSGTSTGTEWSNGAGTAVNLTVKSDYISTSGATQFGFGTQYAVGYALESNCTGTVVAAANLGIPAVTQISASGHALTYAGVPFSIPRAGVVFAINPDPAAVVNIL